MAAVPPLEVDAVITVKTTNPGRLEALEQLEEEVRHFLAHTASDNSTARSELYGAYRTARETK